ncbi:DNA translocase FtsK 4TM domain-containing protein [Ehrlichia sp. JZT12]
MKPVLNKFFFFFKIFLLSFSTAFVFLSILTYHSEDLSFNSANDYPIKNLCGIVGSHMSDLLFQVFGVTSFLIVPLMLLFLVDMVYHVSRNVCLYVISSLTIMLGVSSLLSRIPLGIIHEYYCIGILGACFQNIPSFILISVILIGLLGVIGWKKIVYIYNVLLEMYRNKVVYKTNDTNNDKDVELVSYVQEQLKEFYDDEADGISMPMEAVSDVQEQTEEFYEEDFAYTLDDREEDEESKDNEIEEIDEEGEYEENEEDEEEKLENEEWDGSNDLNDDEEELEEEWDKKTIFHDIPIVKEKKRDRPFILPSVEHLSKPNPIEGKKFHPGDNVASLLDRVLKDFSIHGKIVNIKYGPVVTLYEFEPSAGTKSSRVIGLSDDIARSMSALSTRISVIPGRNVMGIELPNHYREIVMLRDLFESNQYRDSQLKLPIALGKGIDGEVVIADLVKMPHLLIAGTTGSGKSVAINTMILSLIYSLTPDQCKMIMIDPKVLELSVYNSIPHLLTPVVTESKKAVATLKWVVSEMENRYRLMSDVGARNIVGYNDKIKEAINENRHLEKVLQTGFDKNTGEAIFEKVLIEPRIFPYIVVIVDEMADLMLVAGKEIESSIQRLSQMARAAGIHIIMATQRPSVDVITGVIKANFPTRISFAVTSKIDSRTILGEQGAEQLLGMGDMLYMVSGGRIIRVHGAFVSDVEVQDIVEYLKSQGAPEYIEGITRIQRDYDEDVDDNDLSEKDDELYQQAVSIVMRDRRASVSYIQRQLRIGYNRAANLVERMEREGIIGITSAGKREILLE